MKILIILTIFFIGCGDDSISVAKVDVDVSTEDVSTSAPDMGLDTEVDMFLENDTGLDTTIEEQDTSTEDVQNDVSNTEDVIRLEDTDFDLPDSDDVGNIDLGSVIDMGTDAEPDIVIMPYEPSSCKELLDDHPNDFLNYKTANGKYIIFPGGQNSAIEVSCLMTEHEGGWTEVGQFYKTTPRKDNFLSELKGMSFENVLLVVDTNDPVRAGNYLKTLNGTLKTIVSGWGQFIWEDWETNSILQQNEDGRFELNEMAVNQTSRTSCTTSDTDCFMNYNFGVDKTGVYQQGFMVSNCVDTIFPPSACTSTQSCVSMPTHNCINNVCEKVDYLASYGYSNCDQYHSPVLGTGSKRYFYCNAPSSTLFWAAKALEGQENIKLYLK